MHGRLCEARKRSGKVCGRAAQQVELAVPFKRGEQRSEGAVGRVIDPDVCGTHRRVLDLAALRGEAPALIERWGVIR